MKNLRLHFAVAAGVVAALLLPGCKPPQPPAVCAPPLAEGELIALNNANADKVPSLRAGADVEIRFIREGEEQKHRLRDGLLLLLKDPTRAEGVPSFLLRAVYVSEPYFGAGVDAAAGEYYGWLDLPRGYASAARWGNLADVNRPDFESMPVDPTDLLSVLTVLPWPLRDPERPMLSLPKDDPCLYDLLFFSRAGQEGRVQLRRQVWMDRTVVPPRPSRVWVFDAAGRVTVDATLRDYQHIDVPGLNAAERPVMPTDILLRYPQQRDGPADRPVTLVSLHLWLSNLTISTAGSPVRPAMFQRRSVIPSRIEDQRPLGPLTEVPQGEAASRPAVGETAP